MAHDAASKTFETMELLHIVLDFLPFKQLIRLRRVDRTWQNAIDNPSPTMKETLRMGYRASVVDTTVTQSKPKDIVALLTSTYEREQPPNMPFFNTAIPPIAINDAIFTELRPKGTNPYWRSGMIRKDPGDFNKFRFSYSVAIQLPPGDRRLEMLISNPPINCIRIVWRMWGVGSRLKGANKDGDVVRYDEVRVAEGIKLKHIQEFFTGLVRNGEMAMRDLEVADVALVVPSKMGEHMLSRAHGRRVWRTPWLAGRADRLSTLGLRRLKTILEEAIMLRSSILAGLVHQTNVG